MKRIILLFIWACIASACFGDRECEAFDRSREIAKWHLFPDLDSVYTFSSSDQEILLTQERGIISEFETKECTFKSSCDCRRVYMGRYTNDAHKVECNILYDQHGAPLYRPPIFYRFDGIHAWFEVTAAGEMLRVADDTTSTVPFIEFENLENIALDAQQYENVLHLRMPNQSEISDYWIARDMGLVALQKDSVLFSRQ